MDLSSLKADLELMRREIDGAFRLHRSIRERIILLERSNRPRPSRPKPAKPSQVKRKK